MTDFITRPSGLVAPEHVAVPQNRPICIDLFCGAGGMSLGVFEAGFNVVAALDNDPAAAYVYMVNLGAYPCVFHYGEAADKERLNAWMEKHAVQKDANGVLRVTASGSNARRVLPDGAAGVGHFFFGDARRFSGQQILDALGLRHGQVDLVCGSPPCQGFSTANTKRHVMDPRNSLVFDFARLVLEIQPTTMVFENVPGILSMRTVEGVPVVDAFCRILSDGGFGLYDALRHTLAATSGAGALLRHDRGPRERTVRDDEEHAAGPGYKQPGLF